MEIILLIIADLALGGIAWRLGKKNEESNKTMAKAVEEMRNAVTEIVKLNDSLTKRLDRLEDRVDVIEGVS